MTPSGRAAGPSSPRTPRDVLLYGTGVFHGYGCLFRNWTGPPRRSLSHGWVQGIGSVVAGESGGTSRWNHGLCYLFSALGRDGLIPDELSLQLSTFLRSLDLFFKLRIRTIPHSLTTHQPRHGGKQDKHGPELSRAHSSTQHPRASGGRSSETNTVLVNKPSC